MNNNRSSSEGAADDWRKVSIFGVRSGAPSELGCVGLDSWASAPLQPRLDSHLPFGPYAGWRLCLEL